MEESAEEFPAYPARYWSRQDDGALLCELCPRACRLKDGQRGLCFVRARRGAELVLTTYGRSSGFCVDPIEKKPLNHFLPGSATFSFGTAGCNLTCKFCQNWDISKVRDSERLLDQASPAEIAAAARQLKCRSVAFTYNDPVTWLEYAVDTAKACRAAGLRSVAVSAGYISATARPEFFGAMDAANIDLKGFTPRFYRELCSAELHAVMDTLAWVRKHSQTWLELTTLLIPGQNDSDAELRDECKWVAETLGPDTPLHFTAFHPDYKLSDLPPTPASTLSRAREIGLKAGLHYVYTGNVRDPAGATTHCPSCQAGLIVRDGYDITRWNMKEGRCGQCGEPIAGVFEDRPGGWGSRRMQVRMGG